MIDTIKINTPIEACIKIDEKCQSTETVFGSDVQRRDIYRHLGVRFTVSRRSGKGQWLSAEASLPKLLYGHNVGIVGADEVAKGLEWFRTAILTFPIDISLPVIEDWKVSRIDLAYAWQVGNAEQVINDIYPTVKRRNSSDLVIFRDDKTNGMSVIVDQTTLRRIFYDKGEQVKSDRSVRDYSQRNREALTSFSEGVLRFESRSDRRRIRSTLFKGDMTVGDVVNYVKVKSERDLKKDLVEICRSWRPASEFTVVSSLAEKFGPRRVKTLLGTYTSVEAMGVDRYRELIGVNQEVFRRDLADLALAGVGFGKLTRAIRLDVPSPRVVFCRDLNLEDVVASLAKEAA